MKYFTIALLTAVMAIAGAAAATAGEYHSGASLICYDCHSIHGSMQHAYDGGTVSTTPQLGGYQPGGGPNPFLLKAADPNALCAGCHDGKSFAPDVVGANGGLGTGPREAGALNEAGTGAPYETYKGHTLGSTDTPPGFGPTKIGASATGYDPAHGLECVNCHAQHGPAASYRNLGPYSLGGAGTNARPTYAISTTSGGGTTCRGTTTAPGAGGCDVWINLAASWASGAAPATPDYYDQSKVNFNRNDATVSSVRTSNKLGTFCAACHANFHGGPGDTHIGASAAALDGFIRHPTSQVTIGAAGVQGYGGHSSLSRYVANTTKVKVVASDYTAYSDATPICVTCHKAHGNQNPFGLIFLNRDATAVDEQGGLGTGQTASIDVNMRNLCGQCHSQGN